jgi:TRAP-type C4-dicarboxylate transport system substrate-binding protein
MRTIGLRNTVIGLLVMVFIGMTSYSAAAEKPIELKLAQYFSSAQYQSKITAEWAKKVEKESNGRLRIIIFPDSSLLSGPETWAGTVRGVADIGCGWIKGFGKEGMNPYHYGPVAWASLYGVRNAVEASEVGDELMKVFPPYAQEVAELKLLSSFSLQNLIFNSRFYPVHSLADIKGRTVRSGNQAISEFVKYFGGSPLFMPMPEVFLALQKGTIDIMAGFASNLIAYRHADVSRFVTLTLIPGGGPNIGFVGMNWDSWKKLPPDLQKIIESNAEWMNQKVRFTRIEEAKEGLKYARSKGVQIFELPAKEEEKIAKALKEIAKKEAAAMDAKGLKGTEFMEVTQRLAKKFIKK